MNENRRGFLLFAILVVLAISVCSVVIPGKGNRPRTQPYRKLIGGNLPIDYHQKPYSYERLKKDLQNLQGDFGDRIKLSIIGKSTAKRDIFLVKLGKGQRKILIVGGFYWREIRSSMLLVKTITEYATAGQILKNNRDNPLHLFERNRIHVVPMLNPDGMEIGFHGAKAGGDYRLLLQANQGKPNFDRWKSNARGVNLNIQYPYDWKRATSPDSPHYQDYKGPRPESEPESKAIANLIRKEKYQLLIIYHSDGKVIFWEPKGQREAKQGYEMAMAQGISRITGNPVVQGKSRVTRGCLKDWFLHQFHRPVITIE